MTNFMPKTLSIALLAALLTACGGGDGGSSSSNSSNHAHNDNNDNSSPTEPQKDKVEDAQVIEVVEEPTDIDVKDETVIDPTANNDDKVVIPEAAVDKVVLDRLNSRRITCGFGALSVSKKLTDSANNHANYLMYMSRYSDHPFQGHYEIYKDIYSGSKNPYYTGETIQDRIRTDEQKGAEAAAVDYEFRALGENLSFLSYNDAYAKQNSDEQIALNSINGLLAAPYHLASLMSPNFSQVGISYATGPMKKPINLSNGKTEPATGSVLELVSARPLSQSLPKLKVDEVISYPCNKVVDTAYELKNESPNPFKGTARDLREDPIGQPIYILGAGDIQVSNYKMTDAANKPIMLKQLNSSNDPNGKLKSNEVILMPLTALKPSSIYTVSYDVKVDDGKVNGNTFWFKTKAE